jgi:hypothetical protein
MNAEGHRRLAQAVLAGLEKSHDSNWRDPLPPAKKKNKVTFNCNNFCLDYYICFAVDMAKGSR